MTAQHKVLICGDRHWSHRQVIQDFLALLHSDTVVIQGGARGADSIAAELAKERGLQVITHEAQWKVYGKGAGPIRNRKMLADSPELVVGFHDDIFESSKGTRDMISVARLKAVPYMVINSQGVIYQYGNLQNSWIDKLDKSEKLKFKNGTWFVSKEQKQQE